MKIMPHTNKIRMENGDAVIVWLRHPNNGRWDTENSNYLIALDDAAIQRMVDYMDTTGIKIFDVSEDEEEV